MIQNINTNEGLTMKIKVLIKFETESSNTESSKTKLLKEVMSVMKILLWSLFL